MLESKYMTFAAAAIALACAIGWYHSHQSLRHAQVLDTLEPIAEMLKENAALTRELQAAPYAEGANEFVGAYLIQARRDGMVKHSEMKQLIDRVINNNTAILALLAKYNTHTQTAAFRVAAERFRAYAIPLRDRWQSVPEIFMAGGNLPVAAPPYPTQFNETLAAEIAAAGR